ncbi:unnamed protein product [Tuber aestivum]|uniref:Uncharacterized protein n=1 Tax=Tuber aestivum TaxID=59557 RepID=A0A292Q6F8_9PEZI|nr:unnamed protein product [Tuber aestivum]
MATWLPLPPLPGNKVCELPFSGKGIKNTSAVSRARRQKSGNGAGNGLSIEAQNTEILVIGGSSHCVGDRTGAGGSTKRARRQDNLPPAGRAVGEAVATITDSTLVEPATNTQRLPSLAQKSIQPSCNPLGVLPPSEECLSKKAAAPYPTQSAMPSVPEPTSSLRQALPGGLSRGTVSAAGRYSRGVSVAPGLEGDSTPVTARWRSNASVGWLPRRAFVPAPPNPEPPNQMCERSYEHSGNSDSSPRVTPASPRPHVPVDQCKESNHLWRFHSHTHRAQRTGDRRWNIAAERSRSWNQGPDGFEPSKTCNQSLSRTAPSGMASTMRWSSSRAKPGLPESLHPGNSLPALRSSNQQHENSVCKASTDPIPKTTSEASAGSCRLVESETASLCPVHDPMDPPSASPVAEATQSGGLTIKEGYAPGQDSANHAVVATDERTKRWAEILLEAFLEVEN